MITFLHITADILADIDFITLTLLTLIIDY